MKFVSLFVLSLLVLTFAVAAVGEGKNSAAQKGSYVMLKQADGREFRAFVAGPQKPKSPFQSFLVISASPMPPNYPC